MSQPSTNRVQIHLGSVQETLVIPLYGRAVESRKPNGVLRDEKAEQIVECIDYDFAKFDDGWPTPLGLALRAAILDTWTRAFLAEHPAGAVVELGCGLSSRADRLGAGTSHWFDLDLPEVIDLRRQFFSHSERRTMIAASVLDASWIDVVAGAPGPHLFLAEGVLSYLDPDDAHWTLTAIAERFPGSLLAFDTCGQKTVDHPDRYDALNKMSGRLRWACDTPRELERLGLRLHESRTLADTPQPIRARLSLRQRLFGRVAALLNLRDFAHYRVNLFQAVPAP